MRRMLVMMKTATDYEDVAEDSEETSKNTRNKACDARTTGIDGRDTSSMDGCMTLIVITSENGDTSTITENGDTSTTEIQ